MKFNVRSSAFRRKFVTRHRSSDRTNFRLKAKLRTHFLSKNILDLVYDAAIVIAVGFELGEFFEQLPLFA